MPQNTLEKRITKVETNQNNFDKKFDDFVSNHFNHLRKKVDWVLGLIVASVISLLGITISIICFLLQYN